MMPSLRSTSLLLPMAGLMACGGGESAQDEIEEIIIESGCCCDGSGAGGDGGGDDGGGDGEPVGTPDALVPLQEVDLGTICTEGAAAATVEILNVGDAVLNIARVEVVEGGDSWVVDSYPTTLDASVSGDIVLSGGSGYGRIEIETDDPNEGVIEVHLHAQLNAAPVLTLSNLPPVLSPGASQDIDAHVSDDGVLTDVQLDWSSDVDGALASVNPDSSGMYTYTWDSSLQTAGAHAITVTATDACGVSVSETVSFCQNFGYDADSLDLTTWQFTGAASYDTVNEYVQLTPNTRYVAGTAFQTAEAVDSDNISIEFAFWMGPNNETSTYGGSGADGFSVTAIDTTRMTTYQGANGGSIGYGGLPGWSIEVDTWYNSETQFNEPTVSDHVALVIDGAQGSAPEIYAELPELEDGAWHTMTVDVQGQDVQVSIDGTLYLDDTVPALTSFPAHVGFTSATGNQTNEHLIDALTVQNFVCE